MTELLLPAPKVLALPGITRVEFPVIAPWTCSTGEEATRRDPQRPVGYRLDSGKRVRDLWASDRYGITIVCRAPKAHRLCTIYRHAGDPDLLSYTDRTGLVVVEPALWISPHWRGLRVTRWGVPPKYVKLEHVCGRRMANTPINLVKVRAVLAEMEQSGYLHIRSVAW